MNTLLVGIDADDTLWHSESHFAVTEKQFADLVRPWVDDAEAKQRLLDQERMNLHIFGYGVKGFTLSMIETAIAASEGQIPLEAIAEIVGWGKKMLQHPVELLPEVKDTLMQLTANYRLVLITKGDLFHQESKIAESGVAGLFEQVEILTEKSSEQYAAILERCQVRPDQFVMVGNSLRSDVLPVVELGGQGVHIPFELIWGHEKVDREGLTSKWHHLDNFGQLPALLDQIVRSNSNEPLTGL